jgi:indoleamine 2,3-dioxygenase
MEYAGSYALFNYRLADPSQGLASSNLRLIRAFEHGLDPSSSEAGFVLVHIEMVKHSGPLVAGAVACLSSLSSSSRSALNAGLTQVLTSLQKVNATMETMWARSRPTQYTSFRTFIFGITSQSMFPRGGVVYEGVPELGGKPVDFRGESGANDSMIPLVDNLLAIPMPQTPLTEILRDFRSYRPGQHREFLEWMRVASEEGGLKAWALALDKTDKTTTEEEEEEVRRTRALWIQVLDQVRDFRWRHWCFAREYILKRTSHPTATGGSPIVTWLPNQLGAVMDEIMRVYEAAGGKGGHLGEDVEAIVDLVGRQREMLRKEVRKFCEERGVQADV